MKTHSVRVHIMRRLAMHGLCLGVVLLVLAGCYDPDPAVIEDGSGNEVPLGGTLPIARIGQTVVIEGLAVRLISAEFTRSVPGVPDAAASDLYLLAEVEVTRRSGELPANDYASFTLVRADELWTHVGTVVTMPAEIALSRGPVAKGDSVRGFLAFRISVNSPPVTLRYYTGTPSNFMWWSLAALAPLPRATVAVGCGEGSPLPGTPAATPARCH